MARHALAVSLARASSCALLLAACAVDGAGDPSGGGGDPECTGDKCDDLGAGASGLTVANPCPIDLSLGLIVAGDDEPIIWSSVERGGTRWFAASPGDRLVGIDVGGTHWRTLVYVEQRGRLELDPGYCPWDVFVESGTVTEKAADGRDWDAYAVGSLARPDPYATAYTNGEADNCHGHPIVQGSPTSTAADTTTPAWNQETLSWVAWHDMSDSLELEVIDDDVGPGGEPIGYCRFEDIPTPDALPAVITSDCGGGGSFTIRIEPADRAPVDTLPISPGGSCS